MAVLLEDGRVCRIGYTEELTAVSNSIPAPPAVPKEKR